MKIRSKVKVIILMLIVIFILGACNGENVEMEEDDPYIYLEGFSMSIERCLEGVEQIYNRREAFFDEVEVEEKVDFVEEDGDNGEGDNEGNVLEEKEKRLVEFEKNIWEEVQECLEDIHYNWNKYESHEEVDKEKVDAIEDRLNNLSEVFEDKEILSIMIRLNELNLKVTELYHKYDEEVQGDLKKITLYTRRIIYLSVQGEKVEEIDEDLNEIKDLLSKLEGEFEGEEEDRFDELRNAIYDLESAIEDSSEESIKIKGELIMDLVEEIGSASNS
ncbi:hypothetical protein [Halonatronum saccharophilum]|uniref:hypothetical protein n=1 Tax=Halonatronum saccharophilum TaxID=150060 RepID=UPI00048813A7|nr:hypothetical protein [Halonatronum saccharophilum]